MFKQADKQLWKGGKVIGRTNSWNDAAEEAVYFVASVELLKFWQLSLSINNVVQMLLKKCNEEMGKSDFPQLSPPACALIRPLPRKWMSERKFMIIPINSLTQGVMTIVGMKTLPKAQRTRGLSSYQKFVHKYWSNFIFRISTKHQLQNLNRTSASL